MNSITKNAPSRGRGRSAPLDNCATRCLRLKLLYFAAHAAAQAECRRQPSRSFAHFFYFLYCGGPGKRYGSSKKNARGSGAAGGDTRFAPAAIAADVDSFKAQCVCSAVIKRRRSAAAATGSISFVVEFIIRLPLELDSRAFGIVDLKN